MQNIGRASAGAMVAALALLLTACASMMPAPIQQRFEAGLLTVPEVTGTQFEPSLTILGVQRPVPDAKISYYYLRSFVTRNTREVVHQLYVSHYYWDEWMFWESARGDDARELPFTGISSKVESCVGGAGCSHTEIFGIAIDDALLRAKRGLGYSVKIYSRSGRTMVLAVTPEQIGKQLAAVDGVVAGLK